jgi:predicted alpha/beta superfamily hydrolase
MTITPQSRYQVRGIPGYVNRVTHRGRTIDFWVPDGGSDHVLIAHDGQNIFDRKTASFLYTWKLTQASIRIARELKQTPPLIIGVFHSSSKADPHGRGKDLCPEDPFREGMQPTNSPSMTASDLHGNKYLQTIFDEILPELARKTSTSISPNKTAMIGSSMGGLATLYSAIKFHDRFHTALALSPHWTLAGNPLIDWMIPKLPRDSAIRIWMSRGTKGLDAEYEPFQDRVDRMMEDLGWDSKRFMSKVYHRTAHNERSWASYVDEPLRFWLNK